MPKVGLVGPYSPAMKEAFYDSLPQDYEAVEVTATDDYKNLADVDYIINRTLPIDETLLSICPKLKFIAKYAVGFDNIDVAAAAQRNIPATNCKGFNSDSVAELTVALMIDSCRNLYPMYLGLREDNWMQDKFVNTSLTLRGQTVGIIGLGSVGSRVAKLLNAFGSKVVYYDVVRRSEQEENELNVSFLELNDLLAVSDIVTLHCPGSAKNEHLINRETLALMKPTAILINCSRGSVVDEEALYEALSARKLDRAALDVFETEPPVGSELLALPNVIASPHVGGTTRGLGAGMIRLCMQFILDFAGHKPIPVQNVVNYTILNDPAILEVME